MRGACACAERVASEAWDWASGEGVGTAREAILTM